MIDPQQFPQLEAAETRIVRLDRALRYWRANGYAYALLAPAGTATPFAPGQLQIALTLHARHPGSHIIELATDREALIRWALKPRPLQTKESN